ncbi:hypothetical protein CVT24_012474, partial [Panaeolus cyanescens]
SSSDESSPYIITDPPPLPPHIAGTLLPSTFNAPTRFEVFENDIPLPIPTLNLNVYHIQYVVSITPHQPQHLLTSPCSPICTVSLYSSDSQSASFSSNPPPSCIQITEIIVDYDFNPVPPTPHVYIYPVKGVATLLDRNYGSPQRSKGTAAPHLPCDIDKFNFIRCNFTQLSVTPFKNRLSLVLLLTPVFTPGLSRRMSTSTQLKKNWYSMDSLKSGFRKVFKPKKSQKSKSQKDSDSTLAHDKVSPEVVNESSTANASIQTGPSRQGTTLLPSSSTGTTSSATEAVVSSSPVTPPQSPGKALVVTPHKIELQATLSDPQISVLGSAIKRSESDTTQPQTRDVAAGATIGIDDITDNDIVIAVMGATGVGKTTFINSLNTSCVTEELAHHELDAGTKTVTCMKVPIYTSQSDGNLVLVDTPGFDDPSRTNAEVLTVIANWLEKTYRKKRLLNGLIFLQRITDIRLDSGASSTLNIFRHLYGGTGYDKVALVTTMWNDVPPDRIQQYVEKEEELKEHAWKTLLRRNNPPLVARFDATDDDIAEKSAMEVITKLLERSLRETVRTRLQQELVDHHTPLPRTEAGKVAFTLKETVKFYVQPSSRKE